jgi:heat shock protein HtpX
MFKRIGLFLLTNMLVIITVSLVLRLLGVERWMTPHGLNYGHLFVFCLVWGMVGSFVSLLISKWMAKMSMGVEIVDPQRPGQYRELVDMVHRLAQKAGLPGMPEVGVYESPDVNAFATGATRGSALVAVSTGLLRQMDKDQVEGVLGHEIAHVANGDMVTMALVQGVVNAFVMFFARIAAWAVSSAFRGRRDDQEEAAPNFWMNYLLTTVFEMLFGFLGMMVVAWFSRYREYRADAGSATYAGRDRMISALRELQRVYHKPTQSEATSRLAAFKISGQTGGLVAMLATHPPLEERIARLQQSRA